MGILTPIRGRVWSRGSNPASVLSAPNLISIARIALTPAFVAMALANPEPGPERVAAAALFTVLLATDFVDGWIARSRNLVTDLGKLLDPIADKAITGSAFIVLSLLGELPWWITLVVLAREIGVTVYRLVVASSTVIAADWLGKAKTLAQGIALPLALVPFSAWLGAAGQWLSVSTMTIAVVLTIVSGAEFAIQVVRSRRH